MRLILIAYSRRIKMKRQASRVAQWSKARMSLSHCTLAIPVAGRAQCTLTRSPGVQCLVRLASGSSGHCVKKQCSSFGLCFRGYMALDLHLSRVGTGVAVIRQDCNYQLDTTQLWRKRGKKKKKKMKRQIMCYLECHY
jgi:hypothetical protein